MRRRLTKPVVAVLVLATLVAVAGVGTVLVWPERGGAEQGEPPPPLSVTVDPSVRPPIRELPGFTEGATRPVASVADGEGNRAELVADELWLIADDRSELDGLVSRWQGEVLASVDPADLGATGPGTHYLVRVDSSSADPSGLEDDLRALGTQGGELRVSGEPVLRLLAAAAREAAGGRRVGLNFVGRGTDFRGRVSEEAPTASSGGYDQNAFDWSTHSVDNPAHVQQIGVAEAWRVLDFAGKLDNEVKIAILDSGFQPDADFPADWEAISTIPFRDATGTPNLLWCGDFNRCPWHGTNTASAAVAVPDNNLGAAGPGGPVARPILVNTLYDFFSSIMALARARLNGAKIANMSYGVPVPTALAALLPAESAWSLLPFNEATRALRNSGMLLFASAGNEGSNVDAAWGGWKVRVEKAWWAPCENNGVICVGGLERNSQDRDPDSNHGNRQVDIFAPFRVWVGPDPQTSSTHTVNGTSYSSPFVAGVAAMIWAADPGLGADQVRNILFDTAHSSPDDRVRRYVNAFGAVAAATGTVAPDVEIVNPDPGDDLPVDDSLVLVARADDYEDGEDCCTFTWWQRRGTDDRWIALSRQRRLSHTFTQLGQVELAVQATDSDGVVAEARVTVEIVNAGPEVTIVKPAPDTEVFVGATVPLYATATDPNEPGRKLDCDRLVWTSDPAANPFPQAGCRTEVTFDTAGPRTLTLTGTDSHGAEAAVQVRVDVVARPDNPPPSARIILPFDGQVLRDPDEQPVELRSSATDPLGQGLDYRWSVTYPYDPATGTGPQTTRIEPSAGGWLPEDTFDACDLQGQPVRLRLEVVDAQGRTGSDFVVLGTEHCLDG